MSEAFEAQGTLLYWSTSTAESTSASALVGLVQNISGPGGEASEIDITHLNSTAKEFLVGLCDEGNVTLELLCDPTDAGQANLWTDRSARNKRKAKITFNNTSSHYLRFDAYVKGMVFNASFDDAVKVTATLRITGKATLAT